MGPPLPAAVVQLLRSLGGLASRGIGPPHHGPAPQLQALLAAHPGPCKTGLRLGVAGETTIDVALPAALQVAATDELRDGINRLFDGRVVKYR